MKAQKQNETKKQDMRKASRKKDNNRGRKCITQAMLSPLIRSRYTLLCHFPFSCIYYCHNLISFTVINRNVKLLGAVLSLIFNRTQQGYSSWEIRVAVKLLIDV